VHAAAGAQALQAGAQELQDELQELQVEAQGVSQGRSSQCPWSSQTVRISFTCCVWQTCRVALRISMWLVGTQYCCETV
jgi:hypothetical protein